jgi:Xaa-Pro aminopeptidase
LRSRVQKVTLGLRREGLRGAIFVAGPNLRYLLNISAEPYERVMLCFMDEGGDLEILAPKLDEERIRAQASGEVHVTAYDDADDPWKFAKKILADRGMDEGRLGVEGRFPYRFVVELRRVAKGLELWDIDGLLYEIRTIKSEEEIAAIRRSSEILQEAMVRVMSEMKAGMTERQVRSRFAEVAEELGAESVPFCLVQSGPNGARPHLETTNRVLQEGDMVVLDAGCTYGGYFSDVTRTVCLGRPAARQSELFEAVLDAQRAAIGSVKPGIEAQELDRAARGLLRRRGWDRYFIHRTGHGLGLEVHEPPYIKEGSQTKLIKGMVFTIEPGVYIPGEYGIRLEDNIVVTANSYENLTHLPKSLAIRDYL